MQPDPAPPAAPAADPTPGEIPIGGPGCVECGEYYGDHKPNCPERKPMTPADPTPSWLYRCLNPKCRAEFAEYVNGCPKCATGEAAGSHSVRPLADHPDPTPGESDLAFAEWWKSHVNSVPSPPAMLGYVRAGAGDGWHAAVAWSIRRAAAEVKRLTAELAEVKAERNHVTDECVRLRVLCEGGADELAHLRAAGRGDEGEPATREWFASLEDDPIIRHGDDGRWGHVVLRSCSLEWLWGGDLPDCWQLASYRLWRDVPIVTRGHVRHLLAALGLAPASPPADTQEAAYQRGVTHERTRLVNWLRESDLPDEARYVEQGLHDGLTEYVASPPAERPDEGEGKR